jgi:hypothetical protein
VHIWKDGKEARFALEGATITLLSDGGMSDADLRRAAQIVYDERTHIARELKKMPWVRKKK